MTDYDFASFIGYSINGIALHDQARGWRILRDGTSTQGGVTRSISKVSAPGRPGYIPAPATVSEQSIIFTVRTTRAGLEPLLTLCAAAAVLTRTGDTTKQAMVELSSAIPSSDAPKDSMFDVTITLIAYEGVWRDVDQIIVGPINITTPSQDITLLAGISAPIYDADFFIRGVFGQFTLNSIEDYVGVASWVKSTKAWPGSSSTGLLWIGSTQQAFLANESSPWTPLLDMSQYVDISGNGGFRIAPNTVDGDPSNRRGYLSLTTLSQTSVTLRIRARGAYRMN